MAGDTGDAIAEGRLDLVPMIDCVMLLLMFFILTTKFSTEEKTIASLLPTNQGQMASKPDKVTPPQLVNIAVFPADGSSSQPMPRGLQPSEYRAMYEQMVAKGAIRVMPAAAIRIGKNDPIVISSRDLNVKDSMQMRGAIEAVHRAMSDQLKAYEVPGDRKAQRQIVVHAFSGLSWRYALLVYDAVRAYEAAQAGGKKFTGDPKELLEMRSVNFAPPRIRNYTENELGNELYEIVNLQ